MKSTFLMNMKQQFFIKTHLCSFHFHSKMQACNSCSCSLYLSHFLNSVHCMMCKKPYKMEVVCTVIRIKPKHKKNNYYTSYICVQLSFYNCIGSFLLCLYMKVCCNINLDYYVFI